MISNVFAALLTLLLLTACAQTGEPDHVWADDLGPTGSLAACEDLVAELETLETRSAAVGTSAAELLELANRQPEVSLVWPAFDSGPNLDASSNTLLVSVAPRAEHAREIQCGNPAYPEKYRSKPRIELPVVVSLRTRDGVLDEKLDAVLSATSNARAQIAPLTVEPEVLKGRLGPTVAAFYRPGSRKLLFELHFDARGLSGWIGGPFSPHRDSPCTYATYAHWPADATCGEERGGEVVDDADSMTPHLARINRSFEFTRQDGQPTEARFEAVLADGETCKSDPLVEHRVKLRIVTADGRIDLKMDARLSGGPQTIDPWPPHLRNVKPFTLELNGSRALDAASLADQLSYSEPEVSAAIVTVWLSSPVAIDSPVLSGGLRIVPIDRTGFADALPTVELPGGGSEMCFSSSPGGLGPIVTAKIEQH